MPRALWIPDLLRDFGLEPVLVDGWERRGSEAFNPRGSIDHHTAGAATGYIPSLRVLVNGRSDLPGPLCNVAQPRAADGDNRVYVIAAGRANHAGRGGWKGLSGNSSVFGLERENVGTSKEPWSAWSFEVACRVHAAFAKGAGFSPDFTCLHSEWAPKRKVDSHTVTGAAIRNRARELLAGPALQPVPPPFKEALAMAQFSARCSKTGDIHLVDEHGATFNYDKHGQPRGKYLGGANIHDWGVGPGKPMGPVVAVLALPDPEYALAPGVDPAWPKGHDGLLLVTRDPQGAHRFYHLHGDGRTAKPTKG